MVDEPGAIWLPNSNCFPGRNGQRAKWIVLHGTAGGNSAEAIARYFQGLQGSDNAVSAHYVIDQSGVIAQCNAERDGAWANGPVTGRSGVSGDGSGNGQHDPWWDSGINPNLLTISIEHCKAYRDNSDHLTDAQKRASFNLISHICQRNGIPARKADANGGITGHYALDPTDRARCPGPYPWDELFTFLNGGSETVTIALNTPGVANFYEQAPGNVWHCKKYNFLVGNAILDFYRSYGGSGLAGLTHLGLPLSNELGIGNGRVKQHFERGVLVYDPGHTNDFPPGSGAVYVAKIYEGVGQDPRIAQLQAQINQQAPASPPPVDPKTETYYNALKQIGAIVIDSVNGGQKTS